MKPYYINISKIRDVLFILQNFEKRFQKCKKILQNFTWIPKNRWTHSLNNYLWLYYWINKHTNNTLHNDFLNNILISFHYYYCTKSIFLISSVWMIYLKFLLYREVLKFWMNQSFWSVLYVKNHLKFIKNFRFDSTQNNKACYDGLKILIAYEGNYPSSRELWILLYMLVLISLITFRIIWQ